MPAVSTSDPASEHVDASNENPGPAPQEQPKKPAEPPKKRSGLRTGLSIVLGLAAGLALCELAFSMRDDGAFPRLNIYQSDAELGVRLVPGASQRLRVGENPVTDVHINSSGFRGAELPSSQTPAVLVTGDSQVFGLGVQEQETFSAKLSGLLQKPVINAGIPTYGPVEFAKVIEKTLAERKIDTVIYTVNLVNDAFEAARPNTERHAVWDGWAVRKETAPESVSSFPGRAFLFGRSHAVFALRRYLYEQGPKVEDADFRSEGTWEDLLSIAGKAKAARDQAGADTKSLADMYEVQSMYASAEALAAEIRVKKLAFKALKLNNTERGAVYLTAHGIPGDIVSAQDLGEYSRPLAASALYVREAAELRKEIEKELRKKAAEQMDAELKDIESAIADRDAQEQKLAKVLAAPLTFAKASSPLWTSIEQVKIKVEAKGARFVLLVLPMDVQVSKEEWKKYPGAKPVDMESTAIIAQSLVDAAKDSGVSALDATEALRAAEPGAFLAGDIHMTPKGHEAVAKALAETLKQSPTKAGQHSLALPLGRSRVPRPWMWERVGEVTVWGSSAAGCSTQRIREWLRVTCKEWSNAGKTSTPLGIVTEKGDGGEAMTMVWDKEMSLIAPIVRGDEFSALMFWSDKTRRLTVHWPADWAEPDMNIDEVKVEASAPAVSEAAKTLCECYKQTEKKDSCSGLLAEPDADCAKTYAGDCVALLRCGEGHPVYHPSCGASQINAGSALRCFEPEKAPKPAPELASDSVVWVSPGEIDSGLLNQAKDIVEAATKVVEGCSLIDTVAVTWWDASSKPQVYDECKIKEDTTAAVISAVKTFTENAKQKPAQPGALIRFTQQAELFSGWLDTVRRTQITRGTLQGYQSLVKEYNQLQSKAPAAVDPQHVVDVYWGKAYDPKKRNIMAESDYSSIYEGRRKRGLPLVWVRCINGPCLLAEN